MNDNQKWIMQKVIWGWTLLAAGIVAFVIGALLPAIARGLTFNTRIISGVGILLIGLGIAQLVKYRAASRDRVAARRQAAQERDERMIAIRTRAGNRAFWASIALTYGALMWLSFAGGGALPSPSADALWFYLSAAVVLPLAIYVASVIYDNAHS